MKNLVCLFVLFCGVANAGQQAPVPAKVQPQAAAPAKATPQASPQASPQAAAQEVPCDPCANYKVRYVKKVSYEPVLVEKKPGLFQRLRAKKTCCTICQ
jgi:hypothetical protein